MLLLSSLQEEMRNQNIENKEKALVQFIHGFRISQGPQGMNLA
jgi:hypothetical protein